MYYADTNHKEIGVAMLMGGESTLGHGIENDSRVDSSGGCNSPECI